MVIRFRKKSGRGLTRVRLCVCVQLGKRDWRINWSLWLMKRIHRLKLHAVVGAFTLQCFGLLIKYRLTFIILVHCATTRNEFICIERADLMLFIWFWTMRFTYMQHVCQFSKNTPINSTPCTKYLVQFKIW